MSNQNLDVNSSLNSTLKILMSSLEHVKDALWFYFEPIAYYIIDGVLNKFLIPILYYIVNNFILSVCLIVTLPLIFFIGRDIIVTLYKMVIS